MDRKLFILPINYEMLSRILNLPNDCEVIDIFQTNNDKMRRSISVRIEGSGGFTVCEGEIVPYKYEIPQKDGPVVDIREKYRE